MEISVSHFLMVPWWMMFCKIVSHVDGTFPPDELEVLLAYSIFDPVKAHIKRFRELLAHGRVENASGS